MWTLITGVVLWFLGLFKSNTTNTDQKLGAEVTTNAALQEGQKDIRKADDAAKKVDQTKGPIHDPNNLDG